MRKTTPDLTPTTLRVEVTYVNQLLGISLTPTELAALLERMRYGTRIEGDALMVQVPAYRVDVLHPIDVAEDAAIAHGYMDFAPALPATPGVGRPHPASRVEEQLRELMVGAGFLEVTTLMMTSPQRLFAAMGVPQEPVVETENPVSAEHSVVRNWLLPSLLEVLAKNRNREYPQRLFEVGLCLDAQGDTLRRVAAVIAHGESGFSEVKAVVGGLLAGLGLSEERVEPYDHPSFIPGRCAKNAFGFYGEVHPVVLERHRLETPVAAFELNADALAKEEG